MDGSRAAAREVNQKSNVASDDVRARQTFIKHQQKSSCPSACCECVCVCVCVFVNLYVCECVNLYVCV